MSGAVPLITSTPLWCDGCGLGHSIENCPDKKPWEFTPDYFASDEFGHGFFSIPKICSEVRSHDQLHQAYIKGVQGEVNARQIVQEFDSRA